MAKLELVTRKGWGARTSRVGRPMGRVSRLVMHHFWSPDVPASASPATERSVMRGVESFHAAKGWSAAPGYTFVIFDSGRAYVSTGFGRAGVHTAGVNSSSIAFAFANNGDQAQPTPAAWNAAHKLMLMAIRGGHLTRTFTLNGHYQFAAKTCPGTKTRKHLNKVRTGVDAGGGAQQEDEPVTKSDARMVADMVVARLTDDAGFLDAVADRVIFATRFNQYGVRADHNPEHVNLATAVNRAAQAATVAAGGPIAVD